MYTHVIPFFFKLTVLHVRSLIRHDLNLGNALLCGAERGNTEKLGLLNNHFYFLKVIINIYVTVSLSINIRSCEKF